MVAPAQLAVSGTRKSHRPADNRAMRLAILGFGLIGGSVARALAARRASSGQATWSVAAWSPSGRGPAEAAADGTIETAARDTGSAIDGADVVVLAAPPLA